MEFKPLSTAPPPRTEYPFIAAMDAFESEVERRGASSNLVYDARHLALAAIRGERVPESEGRIVPLIPAEDAFRRLIGA